MKVVFTSFNEESAGGGEVRVAFELARAFARNNETLLIIPGKTNALEKEAGGLKKLHLKSRGDTGLLFPILDYTNSKFLFKNLTSFAPDVIHAQSPDILSFMVQMWSTSHHVPFILTTHELPTKRNVFGANESSAYLGKLLDLDITKGYFKAFYNNCDAIIALNEAAKRDIEKAEYGGPIYVIHNGRDLEKYINLKINKISNSTKELLFTGWISDRKNQLYLAQVMAHLPSGFHLTIVGDILCKKYKKTLDTFIRERGLTDITFAGLVDPARIPEYLEKSLFFISASKVEVQSLSVIEALAAGRPVIGLSNETIDELVDEKVGLRLAKNTNPKEFAAQIVRLSALPQQEYEKLCRSARERVLHMDWKNVVDKTVAAYEDVIVHKEDFSGNHPVVKSDQELITPDANAFFKKYFKSFGKPIDIIKEKSIYRKLKGWGEKTKGPYRYLPGVFLVAFTLGATYGVVSSISKLRKKQGKAK